MNSFSFKIVLEGSANFTTSGVIAGNIHINSNAITASTSGADVRNALFRGVIELMQRRDVFDAGKPAADSNKWHPEYAAIVKLVARLYANILSENTLYPTVGYGSNNSSMILKTVNPTPNSGNQVEWANVGDGNSSVNKFTSNIMQTVINTGFQGKEEVTANDIKNIILAIESCQPFILDGQGDPDRLVYPISVDSGRIDEVYEEIKKCIQGSSTYVSATLPDMTGMISTWNNTAPGTSVPHVN
jgi:hypothetical protein